VPVVFSFPQIFLSDHADIHTVESVMGKAAVEFFPQVRSSRGFTLKTRLTCPASSLRVPKVFACARLATRVDGADVRRVDV
jgi:hypothetical protein